jgi:hypothetical protein
MVDRHKVPWFVTYGWRGMPVWRVPVHPMGCLILLLAIGCTLGWLLLMLMLGVMRGHPFLGLVSAMVIYIAVLSLGRQHHEYR